MEIVAYRREHLEPIIALAEGSEFPATLVAVEAGAVLGFAHTITDGAPGAPSS
jgi:hypothetical protein